MVTWVPDQQLPAGLERVEHGEALKSHHRLAWLAADSERERGSLCDPVGLSMVDPTVYVVVAFAAEQVKQNGEDQALELEIVGIDLSWRQLAFAAIANCFVAGDVAAVGAAVGAAAVLIWRLLQPKGHCGDSACLALAAPLYEA